MYRVRWSLYRWLLYEKSITVERKGLQGKMSEAITPKYKIKGNESFGIREGWLNKGLTALEENKTIFSEPVAMDSLGVGSKMVKAIKYWLLASHLVEEKREKNSKHSLIPTSCFGEIVKKYDPYFEDIFTLWIIHYYI